MATRRTVLATLVGFLGGSVYGATADVDVPDEVRLPDDLPRPPELTPTPGEPASPQPRDPESSDFSESERERARAVGLEARESVVFLETARGGGEFSIGTGWVLDGEHVVTNGHIVDRGGTLTCYTVEGETLDVEVVDSTREPDVGLVVTDDDPPRALETGSSADLDSTQPLVQVGHPGGVGRWIITLGRFLGRGRSLGSGETLRSSVPSRQGSSGSPVLTLDGTVVGLTFASAPQAVRRPGTAPEPTDDRVYERLRVETNSLHVPIEETLETVRRWT